MEDVQKVKENLYELYKVLKEISKTKSGRSLLAPHILEQLIYPTETIKKVLFVKEGEPIKKEEQLSSKKDKKSITQEIQNKEQLKAFYISQLLPIFDPRVDEQAKNKLRSAMTIEELKRLYTLISPVTIPKSKKKQDVLYLFKNYFDEEIRTEDMNRHI